MIEISSVVAGRSRFGMDKIYKFLAIATIVGLFVGCSSITNVNKTAGTVEPTGVLDDPDNNPTDDSPYALSPRRQIGHGFSIDIFGGDKKDGDDPSQLAIDDPEYAEYLEWKRWQEFKAYQEWKAQQKGTESAS